MKIPSAYLEVEQWIATIVAIAIVATVATAIVATVVTVVTVATVATVATATVIVTVVAFLSGVPDYFGRNKISSGGDLSHYSSASLY